MRKFVFVGLGALLAGCGGGGAGGESGDDITRDISFNKLNLSNYQAIGSADSATPYSVGIDTYLNIESLEPETDETAPSCLPPAPIDIRGVLNIGKGWKIITAQVPTHYLDCQYVQSWDKSFFVKGDSFIEIEGITIQVFDAFDSNIEHLAANSSFNDSDSAVVFGLASDGMHLYSVSVNDELPTLKKLHNNFPSHPKDKNFALIHEGALYFKEPHYDGDIVKVVDGDEVDRWSFKNAETIPPFRYKGKVYSGTNGGDYIELLDSGQFGGALDVPLLSGAGAARLYDVIDDRYLIGFRCVVSDMENRTAVRIADNPSSMLEVKDGYVYCAGITYDLDGSGVGELIAGSLKLGETTLTQRIATNDPDSIFDISADAPYIAFKQGSGAGVESVVYNLLTGEQSTQYLYHNGNSISKIKVLD